MAKQWEKTIDLSTTDGVTTTATGIAEGTKASLIIGRRAGAKSGATDAVTGLTKNMLGDLEHLLAEVRGKLS